MLRQSLDRLVVGASVAPLLTERIHFGLASEKGEMSREDTREEDIQVKGLDFGDLGLWW